MKIFGFNSESNTRLVIEEVVSSGDVRGYRPVLYARYSRIARSAKLVEKEDGEHDLVDVEAGRYHAMPILGG